MNFFEFKTVLIHDTVIVEVLYETRSKRDHQIVRNENIRKHYTEY
jgi:hypothetical protein